LTEECAAILEATGVTEEEIKLSSTTSHSPDPPQPIAPMGKNWPILPSSRSLLEKALTDELGDLSLEEPGTNGYADDLNAFEKGLDGTQELDLINVGEDGESWEEVGDGAGWDMGDEEGEEDELNLSAPEAQAEGVSDAEYWIRNSPLAADHIAAGSFETAMQLLNRQVGAVNFQPLKPKFMQIYQASRTFLAANPGLPSLELYVRRDQGDRSRSLPRLPWDYEKIKTVQMREALKLVTANKVEEAISSLREILHTLLLFAASSKSEAEDVAKTVETIREYVVGLSIEVARRGLDVSAPEGVKRNLELAAYFTNFQLTPQHRGLAYMQAMTQFNKYKNIATAGVFAQKYIALGLGKADADARVRSSFVPSDK
jgi:coatomer subunit alpha